MSLISKIESNKYFFLLLLFLCIKTLFLLILVGTSFIGLTPDEAQYWTWSKALDFGYFSKPPAIAWQLFTTTFFFGDTELGIRIGAIAIGFILSLTLYLIAKEAGYPPLVGFWTACAFAFSPLGFYLSFAATTDGGAILFLTLGVLAVVKKEGPNYFLAGLYIFLGGLYKWTAFVLWPFVLIFACFSPLFRKKTLALGILISLCALLPVIYWNSSHDWATFRHVSKTTLQTHKGNFFDFLFSQIGLISPIYFILLCLGFVFLFKRCDIKTAFCAAFPFTVVCFLILSLFKKMQPNWAAFLYPAGMLLIGIHALSKRMKVWLHLGTYLSLSLGVLAFSVPWLQGKMEWQIPYVMNPFRQSMGWNRLPGILLGLGYNPQEDFLFGDKYQTASILSFYSPGKKRAYFFNISDTRKNQFSYWPQMDEKEVGKTGYFFVLENTGEHALEWYRTHYLQRLSPYFKKVEEAGAFPLFYANGHAVKYALVFRCIDYSGKIPTPTVTY